MLQLIIAAALGYFLIKLISELFRTDNGGLGALLFIALIGGALYYLL